MTISMTCLQIFTKQDMDLSMVPREVIMSPENRLCPLQRKLLIAVDGSENSDRAVTYVACMLGEVRRVSISLLHIISIPPDDYFHTEDEQKNWIEEHEKAAITAIEKHAHQLIDAGITETAVRYTIRKGIFPSVAEVILEELVTSGASTLVIGRQGISKKEEFIYGSTSNKLLHAVKGSTALWVIE